MPFITESEALTHAPFPGVEGRVVHADGMTLAFWDLPEGAIVPEHAHVHEQLLHVVSGSLEVTIGDETRRLEAGGTAVIPSNLPHTVRVEVASHVIDVFTPARREYGSPAKPD